MKLIRHIALALGALLATTAVAHMPYRNLVIFGDSLSDNGNLYAMTYYQKGGPIPNPRAWFNGRWSNGIVWDEYMAPMLNLPTSSLYNFAYGGAKTGFDNVNDSEAPKGTRYPGLLTEVSLFIHHNAKQRLDANTTLYVIWAGGDNYLDGQVHPHTKPSELAKQIKVVSTQTAEAVSLLANRANAKHFLIISLPDLSKTPRLRIAAKNKPGLLVAITALVQANNKALAETVDNLKEKLRTDIKYVDINKIFSAMTNHPKQFGFTNVTQPCFDRKTMVACPQPNQYLFWGVIHPTTRAHEIFAKYIFQQI